MPVHSKAVVFLATAVQFGKLHSGRILAQSISFDDFQSGDQTVAAGVGSFHNCFIGSGFFDRDIAGAYHYAQRLPHNLAHFAQPGINTGITGQQVDIGFFIDQTGDLAALPDDFQLNIIIFQHYPFGGISDRHRCRKHRCCHSAKDAQQKSKFFHLYT